MVYLQFWYSKFGRDTSLIGKNWHRMSWSNADLFLKLYDMTTKILQVLLTIQSILSVALAAVYTMVWNVEQE
jgi:hypothetical protein